jgi:hypothetical protein
LAREAARRGQAGDVDGALNAIRRLEERARDWDLTLRLSRPGRPGPAAGAPGFPRTAANSVGAAEKKADPNPDPRLGNDVGAAEKKTVANPAPRFGIGAEHRNALGPRPAASRGPGGGFGTAPGSVRPGDPFNGVPDQERRLREVERKLDEVLQALKDLRANERPADRSKDQPANERPAHRSVDRPTDRQQ